MRSKVIVIVTVLLSFPAIAESQVWEGMFVLGPSAGPTLPIDHFDDSVRSGSLIGVTVQRFFSTRAGASVEVHAGRFTEQAIPKTTVRQAIINGCYVLDPFTPITSFLTAGIGVYSLEPNYTRARASTDFGINGGIGFLVPIGSNFISSSTFRFHNVFTAGETTPYVGLTVTLLYVFGESPYL